MKKFAPATFLFALGVLALPLAIRAAAPAKCPNIVLVLTDDQGWSQLSARMDPRLAASRSTYLETPNMNRLMDGGMRFTSGYSPAPLCTPTRRAILCGTSAARSGTEFKSKWVPAEHMTIPRALKAANPDYRCAHFGKWGEQMISTPEECGYDFSDGMTGNRTGGMPDSLGVKGGHADGPPHFIDNEDPKRTSSITTKAIDFMAGQKKSGKPFYVQVSYYAQHLSVVCSEAMLKKYEDKGTPDRAYTHAWAAMMEELDDGVGRLLDALETLGVADSTYVFFTADNGGRGTVPGGDVSRLAPNHPLSGAKHSLMEGGIRVPFIARGPGISAGSVSHVPVAGYDFLPTFVDLAGGGRPDSSDLDGGSFKRLLIGGGKGRVERPEPALFFHRPRRRMSAVRQGGFKLMLDWDTKNEVTARHLYAVGKQPTEDNHDIASKQPGKADLLQALLLEHLRGVDAERVKPGNPRKKGKGRRR